MKISARNVLKGKIVEVTKGATTAHVKIDIGGAIVTSSITNAAVDELKLAVAAYIFGPRLQIAAATKVLAAIDAATQPQRS